MTLDRFVTRWIDVWGGGRVWAVHTREPYGDDWKRVSRTFKSSAPADRLRDRMNADDRRYQNAMLEKRYG